MRKLYKILTFCAIISFIIVLQIVPIFANVTISKLEIQPLNRAIVYLSGKPNSISSELSAEKTKISVKIPSASIITDTREVHSTGIINSIYAQKSAQYSEISVLIKEPRGFTTSFLPYTNRLFIEVFNWERLNIAEDAYRSGLLALEDGLYGSAKFYLNKAFDEGISDAGMYLGFLLIQENKIDDALSVLKTAELKGSKEADLFAALAQIHKQKGESRLATEYEKKFSEITGLSNFRPLATDNIKIDDLSEMDTLSLLYALSSTQKATEDATQDTIIATDSIATVSEEIPEEILEDKSFIPFGLSQTVFYVIIIALLILLVLISSYIKWRKQQLESIKKQTKNTRFDEKLSSAKNSGSVGAALAAQKYQKQEKQTENILVPEKQSESKISNKKTEHTKIDKDSNPKEIQIDKHKLIEQTQNKETDNFNIDNKKYENIEKLAKEILAHKQADESHNEGVNADTNKKPEKTSSFSPKIELAMHLQKEQQKLKNKNIQSLKDIPKDVNKLSEVAKKLGIEKDTLETKRMLNELEKDKKGLSKLAEKFSADKAKK